MTKPEDRAAAIRDEAKLFVDDQGRFCATINRSDYEWLLEGCGHSNSEQPAAKPLPEVFREIFGMDENGDPVGARPETEWERGYCAGLRVAYRTLKSRSIHEKHGR